MGNGEQWTEATKAFLTTKNTKYTKTTKAGFTTDYTDTIWIENKTTAGAENMKLRKRKIVKRRKMVSRKDAEAQSGGVSNPKTGHHGKHERHEGGSVREPMQLYRGSPFSALLPRFQCFPISHVSQSLTLLPPTRRDFLPLFTVAKAHALRRPVSSIP